ncbi:YaaC family protein [uncultured Methanobrevibacter sp.]|uniref:YaaC family protein n=1 Tax=uncultured Methanobrevibacter sp. TaxID=253161 RepID=UPI0025D17C4B|nr:YaaC family protein [uncultured Methanobrevibacter sp.]
MKKEVILTEDPNKELWNQFKQFENYGVCLNYLKSCKKFDNGDKFKFRAKLMKYYITQAKEYYLSARDSSVLTRPTLLYYGASCLVKTLILSKRCYEDDSGRHGITVSESDTDDLMGFKIKPSRGTFLELYQVLENNEVNSIRSIDFNLEDLLSFIPELKDDFENVFNKKSLTIKVDRIKDEDGEYLLYEGDYFSDESIINNFFSNVPNFDKYYFSPYFFSNGMSCFKKSISDGDIVLRNIMGEEFLVSSLSVGENFIYLSQISVHFLILYLLSMLSRYYVNIWQSENSSDEDRYFYIIEKFLDISERKFPNLILNEILNKEIIFSVEYYRPSGFDFDEIKGMIEEIVKESIEENNLKEEKEEIQRRVMDDFYNGRDW